MKNEWKKGYILTMRYRYLLDDERKYVCDKHSFIVFDYMLKNSENDIEKHIKKCYPKGKVEYIDEIEYKIDYNTLEISEVGERFCNIEIKGYSDIENIDIDCGWLGECFYDTEKRMFRTV